jgi:serine/threonine protein kinase
MFDLGEEKGTRYITMEYVRGEDLRQLIRKVGRLSPGQAVAVARQVCDGLAEAHSQGVVHRDLKPDNIMLDETATPGSWTLVSPARSAGRDHRRPERLSGRPSTLSPEQVEGKDVDERSDIYSLGVILYEMVTGSACFDGETPLASPISTSRDAKTRGSSPPKSRTASPASSLSACKGQGGSLRERPGPKRRPGLDRGAFRRPRKALPKQHDRDITVTFNLKTGRAGLGRPGRGWRHIIILVKVIGGKKPSPAAPPSSGKASWPSCISENQTERPGLDKMAVTLLTTNLSRNEDLEVTSTQRLFDILKLLGKQDARTIERSLATEVATRAGVKTMLVGSIIQIGGRIRLTAELIDVKTGSIVGTQIEDGTKYDDLFAMVDGITEQVGKQLGGGKSVGGLKVADVTHHPGRWSNIKAWT